MVFTLIYSFSPPNYKTHLHSQHLRAILFCSDLSKVLEGRRTTYRKKKGGRRGKAMLVNTIKATVDQARRRGVKRRRGKCVIEKVLSIWFGLDNDLAMGKQGTVTRKECVCFRRSTSSREKKKSVSV
jgi:hypothetical protein